MDVILNPRTWQGAIRNVREMLPGVEKSVQPASSPTGGAEGRKGRQTSRLGEIALALGASTFFLGVLAILLWALVRHGQSNPGEAEARCRDRINAEKGFDGDPDFYGLGIRVGIYLQWITCLVTCAFLPSERESATMTYLIFSISIAVATLVKVFANRCTFVAEMYVILILFWGGFTVVPLSLMRAIAISKVYQPDPAEQMRPLSRKLRWGSHLLNFIMSPVTVWFWIRLASVGQQDFAPGPIGTSLFFFVKIEHGQITGFSIFMAVAATVNFLFFGFALLNPSLGVQRRWMDSLMWIPLLLLLIPILFLNILVELVIVGAVAIVISSCLWLTQKLSRSSLATEHKLQKQATDDLGPISDSEDLGEHAMPSASLASYLRLSSVIPLLVSIWCILAVELTLKWNAVSGIYNIQSTGQVIPFVTGVSIVLDTSDKLIKTCRRRRQISTAETSNPPEDIQSKENALGTVCCVHSRTNIMPRLQSALWKLLRFN